MSIFRYIRTRPTGFRVIDRIRPVEIGLSVKPTGVTRPQIDSHAEFEVELVLRQNFWANRAQEEGRTKYAIDCIAADLYEDVLRELPRLRNAIASGDRDGALEAVSRIEQATRP